MKRAGLALALACAASAAPRGIDINTANRTFVDKAGRQVLFHGVNVVYKIDPYIPAGDVFDTETSLTDKDVALLQKWGMNFVRLGVMWEAVERAPGVYNNTYLDEVEKLINKLGDAGIYTLVDAHQDVFARVMCGEGVPNFYAKDLIANDPYCISKLLDPLLVPVLSKLGLCTDIESFGFRKDADGNPLIEDCQTRAFAGYYTTKQSLAAFRGLFTNALGVQDKFVSYWEHVAARYASNPYVVGYDPLNEPFLVNPLKDPRAIIPGQMDKKYLAPLYERVYKKYQASDASKQMWFEPVPVPDEAGVLGGFVFPVGFDSPPGGAVGSATHVLNDHTYCCQIAGECDDAGGEPKVDDAEKCQKWHAKRVGQRVKDAQRLGVPFIVTEFGACLTEGPCTQEINQVGDLADANLFGWAYWQYKDYKDLTTSAGTGSEGFWNKDGTLQDYKVKALARSYLPLTQGTLTAMSFDTTTAAFAATFAYSAAATAASVAYLNEEYWYLRAPEIEVTVNGAPADVEGTYANNYYTFDVSQVAGIKDGDSVTITAARKAGAF